MQRAARSFGRIELSRLGSHAIGIKVHQRIQRRVEPLDLADVRLGQFNN